MVQPIKPICKHEKTKQIGETNFNGKQYTLTACEDCGIVICSNVK